MKEKPDVLSYKIAEFAFNLVNQGKGEVSGWHRFSGKTEWLDKVTPLIDWVKAYYEPVIEQERRLYYDGGYAKAVRDNQAKAEVAREIFEEIEEYHKSYRYALIAGSRKEDTYDLHIKGEAWEGYKDKFLKEAA